MDKGQMRVFKGLDRGFHRKIFITSPGEDIVHRGIPRAVL